MSSRSRKDAVGPDVAYAQVTASTEVVITVVDPDSALDFAGPQTAAVSSHG